MLYLLNSENVSQDYYFVETDKYFLISQINPDLWYTAGTLTFVHFDLVLLASLQQRLHVLHKANDASEIGRQSLGRET